jgi:alpha-beta hydrolase superfamily lysophospholipase
VNRVNAPDGTPLVFDAYEAARPRAAVLFLSDWQPQPDAPAEPAAALRVRLRDEGVAAYFLDQRGHGRSGGRRGHLSRFSQLLGDLQTFRRAVQRLHDVPQVLVGEGFGGLVVLRYLETQPGEPPAGAVVSGPWLATRAAAWKRVAAKLADLWPTMPTGRGREFMTVGARAELEWAQRAVRADYQRIERPVLFMLGAQDPATDPAVARAFAEQLAPRAEMQWYADLSQDLFRDPRVLEHLMRFIAGPHSSDRHPTEQ